jgi:hypothetical protein
MKNLEGLQERLLEKLHKYDICPDGFLKDALAEELKIMNESINTICRIEEMKASDYYKKQISRRKIR